MRDYSKVSTTIWRSQKFKELGGDDRSEKLYFYMLTNPHVNSAGCYDLPEGYALEDLKKWNSIAYREAIADLQTANLIAYDRAENTVLVINWLAHNPPTNAKHAINMLKGLAQASSRRLKTVRGLEIDTLVRERGYHLAREGGVQLERLLIGYRAPQSDSLPIGSATLTETYTQTETETLTKTDTETSTKASAKKLSPPSAALPMGAQPALGEDGAIIPKHLHGASPELQALIMGGKRNGRL